MNCLLKLETPNGSIEVKPPPPPMHRVAYIQVKKNSRLHEYTLPFNKQVLVFPRIIVPI